MRQLTKTAGVIFAGEVVAVQRPAGTAGSALDASEGLVMVEFRVDEAVRGCTGGSIYTLREWAGLWTGPDRYRIGQHLLVFLHSPGRDGLSSPVGGQAGMVPLRGGGQAPGPYDAGAVASEWLADLRWVQAKALRDGGWSQPPAPAPVRPAQPIRGRLRGKVGKDAGDLETDPFLPVFGTAHWVSLPQAADFAAEPLSQVLGLCRAWVRAADGAL